MPILMSVVISLLGLLVGALAGHLAEAVMVGQRLARPDCPYCTTPYRPMQWSATLALVTGRGRCRGCGRFFRLPRLVGELFLGISWGLLVGFYGLNVRVLFTLVTVIPLEMIMVTDLEAKRVPNLIILPSIGAMALLGLVFGPALPTLRSWSWWNSPLGGLVGFIVLRILVSVGVAVFGEGAMGEGDMTLATYAGAVVGFPMVIEALLLAFVLGGAGALLVLVTRRGSLKTAIPYGPFIILGCAVTLIWGPAIARWFLT